MCNSVFQSVLPAMLFYLIGLLPKGNTCSKAMSSFHDNIGEYRMLLINHSFNGRIMNYLFIPLFCSY